LNAVIEVGIAAAKASACHLPVWNREVLKKDAVHQLNALVVCNDAYVAVPLHKDMAGTLNGSCFTAA
jgi:hypothetical protein